MTNSRFIDCVSYEHGGAVYVDKSSAGSVANVENCTFTRCSSVDGGAIWTKAQSTTLADCTISDCTATGNGGGVYLKHETATMSKVISGGTITNCQAKDGSAVYSENKAVFSGLTITGNTVTDINAGAIHGGTLYFEGDTVVQDNTCSGDPEYNHDVLLQNNNTTTIYTTENGLGEKANVGVYVIDKTSDNKTDVFVNRGLEGKAFGTWNNSNYLDSFFNDRNEELFGYGTDTDKYIYWGPYLCKITDGEGNTLKRANGRDAIYQRLSIAIGDFPNVLDKNGETGKAVYIKMLVENYTLQQEKQIENFPDNANITLTTAGRNEPDNKHSYRGAEGTVCTISRTNSTNPLFKLTKANTTFRLTNITLDGRSDKSSDVGTGYRLMEATDGNVIVDGGTTMQYAKSDKGAAIKLSFPAELVINSRLGNDVLLHHCTVSDNGGAIYSTGNLTITRETGADGSASTTTFKDCSAKLSGAICVEGSATLAEVDGAVFENCSAINSEGGAFYFKRNYNDAKVVIRNSNFNNCYTTHTNETDGGNLQGGAINCWAGTLVVENCAFTECTARGDGGAIYHVNGNKIKTELVNCTFENCGLTGTVNRNGGAVYTQAKQVIITNCAFTDCSAIDSSGALHCHNSETGSETIISGTTFENCYANGETSYGGAIYSNTKALTLQDWIPEDSDAKATEIRNCAAKAYSGAVYMNGENSTLNITGNTLISGCYANLGGAIYLRNKATLKLTGSPEFTKNGYATWNGTVVNAEKGACIYLVEGGAIYLKDSPKFSRNNITNVDRVINGGNTDYVRQDIYLAGYASNDAESINVAGELTGDTIWVWPEQNRHQLPNNQFAMTEAGVSDASLQKFRNALADSVTGCSNGEYLAGVRLPASDKTGKKVYWSKMYNVSFRKIDNKGVAVPGAEFTLYSNPVCTAAYKVVSAVSADGENDKDALGEVLAKGTVDFVSIPIGIYYLKETKTPTSFKTDDTVYILLVGTPSLNRNENSELWVNGGVLDVANAQDLIAKATTNSGKYYGVFPIKDGKADLSKNLAGANVGITNIRNDYEAWFMKTDSSGAALPGAAFTIYAQELDKNGEEVTYKNGYPQLLLWSRTGEEGDAPDPVKSADGTAKFKKLDGTTVPKGMVYFRELPIGTYYLVETTYPERNGSNRKTFYVEEDRVFKLVVKGLDDQGQSSFTLSEWQENGEYKDLSKNDDGNYVVSNNEAVCKLTDGNDNLLYRLGHDGVTKLPAIYSTIEGAFAAAQQNVAFVNKDGGSVSSPSELKLKVLKDFTLTQPITYDASSPKLTLTTAEREAKGDKYVFVTSRTTNTGRAELLRGYSANNDGALITVSNGASLTLQNISLNGQKSNEISGRAIRVQNGDGKVSSLTIKDNTLFTNFQVNADSASGARGGAILMDDNTVLTVDGGTQSRSAMFTNNTVNKTTEGEVDAHGGAIAIGKNCTVDLRNVQFANNSALEGSAIYVASSDNEASPTEVPITNASITGNRAGGANGGAINTSGPNVRLYFGGSTEVFNNTSSTELSVQRNVVLSEDSNDVIWTAKKEGVELTDKAKIGVYVIDKEITAGEGAGSTLYKEHGVAGKPFGTFEIAGHLQIFVNDRNLSLYGVRNEEDPNDTFIYWISSGVPVAFMKIDSYGEALGGAAFTLFTNAECTEAFEKNAGEKMIAESADGATTKNSDGKELEKGTVLFEEVPAGVYYMKERKEGGSNTMMSGTPNGYAENANTYIVLVGTEALTVPEDADRAGTIWAGVLAEVREVDVNGQTSQNKAILEKCGLADDAQYAIFLLEQGEGAAGSLKAVTTPDIAKYGVMNASKDERKVILRKVNTSYNALAGATFEILRADLSPVTDSSKSTTTFTSSTSGVYFIGELPYGTYYVHETKTPAGIVSDYWFYLIVDENGAYMPGTEIIRYSSQAAAAESASQRLAELKAAAH